MEDDGPGLGVPGERAVDPFFTTKPGKKVGLGLSLLKFRAEQAGGGLEVGRSALGGTAVRAWMGLRHVDRSPSATWPARCRPVVCTRAELGAAAQPACGRAGVAERGRRRRGLPEGRRHPAAVAVRMRKRIQEGLAALQVGIRS